MAILNINLPFSVSPNLSGYTNSLTTFLFTPTFSSLSATNFDTSKALWNFGDGIYSTEVSSSHVYNSPGIYEVSVILYDVNGTVYQDTFTASITATNLIQDLIYITPVPSTIFNIPAGQVSLPFTANRINSWQSYPALSAVGYTFNLYVSGSLSNKLNLNSLSASKWAHIDRTWRFVEQNITADGIIQYLPIDNIKSSSVEIYYKIDSNTNNLVQCNKNDAGSVFVGTSGAAVFYYIDDTPKNFDSTTQPVIIFVSLDTTLFPDSYQIITSETLSYTIFPELELFQHLKAAVPARIRYNVASEIIFTAAGMPDIPISQNKWQNTKIPFFINFVDSTGSIVENYPPLLINTSSTPNSALNVVNLVLLDSNLTPLSADFYTLIDDQLPPSISATFRGFFIPYQTGNNVTLSGYVSIFNVQNTQLDTTIGWVTFPDTSTIYKVSPEVLSNTYNLNKNSILAIAAVPSASPDISVLPYAWFGDVDTDTLVKMDTVGNILGTVVLSTALNTTNKLSPSYISIDGNNDIWVTLIDNAETIKINSQTLSVVLSVIPNVTNVQYLSANVPNVFGGSNLIEPGLVDVDRNNNAWVCYTNPLCCFVEKYNGTTGAILSTFPLPQGLVPCDIVIDSNSNVWVTAEFSTSINPGKTTLVSPVTASKLGKDTFGFGKFQYTFNTTLSTILSSVNYLLTIDNLNDKFYNGTFLIESVSGKSITVEPHPLAWYHASSQSITLSANNPILQLSSGSTTCSAIFTFSDRAYRISPSSNVTMIDGFYSPSYITVDTAQDVWISHSLCRVSKITQNGNSISTNFTVGSAQFVLQTVDQQYLMVDNSQNLFEMLVTNPDDRVIQHIEGVTCDTTNRLWVINDFENRLYFLPLNNLTLSAITWTDFLPPISANFSDNRKTLQAAGDWNGMRWINKYPSFKSFDTLQGSLSFNVLPTTGAYKIAKINENFDASGTYKSYRFTERLQEATNLFDNFIGQAVDDITGNPEVLGKHIYERIANFSGNLVDIDTCDLTALYSLCDELDIPIDNYEFLLPANLKRITNLASIKHSKLWGNRSKFNRNFDTKFSQNSSFGTNLGSKINTSTYIVSAGTNLIFNQIFNNEYFLVKTMILSGFTAHPLSAYPLSSYDPTWGWGLENGVTGKTLSKYYIVYTYNSQFDNTQLEGVIDWNNPYNTIVETNSATNVWLDTYGIVDTMIDYQMHKGLDLFLT